jgi:hypothetical protein
LCGVRGACYSFHMTQTTTPAEIARHMISKDWGILITRVVKRDGSDLYKVNTVARISGELRSHPFAHAATEQEARDLANREWKVQTRK